MVKHIMHGALPTLAVVLFLACGCTKEEEPQAKAEPASVYMKDPAYAAAKEKVMASRATIVSAREKLIAEMEQMVADAKAKLPGADDATVKAELEKNPTWVSLVKRMEDANVAYEDNLSSAHKLIGERMSRKTISK